MGTRALHILPLALVALGFGCGEPLSNEVFEGDERFRAAIPEGEDVVLLLPANAAARAEGCVSGDLYTLTFNTMGFINDVTQGFLESIQRIVQRPITTRTEDSRAWGPYFVAEKAAWMTLTVERREEREADELVERYAYWLNASPTEDGQGEPVLWGSWDPDYSIEAGVGEMHWDQGFFADGEGQRVGLAHVSYDTRAARAVSAFLDDFRLATEAEGQGTTITCAYEEDGEGGGWFEYENKSDIVQVSDAREELEVTSRWLADGSGRSEGRYADGDLGLEVVSLVECWDDAGCQVLYRDTYGLSEPVGTPNLCSLEDVVVP